jgi:hypothetical protein
VPLTALHPELADGGRPRRNTRSGGSGAVVGWLWSGPSSTAGDARSADPVIWRADEVAAGRLIWPTRVSPV